MRTTIEDNKKHFQKELWTCGQTLTKLDSDSITLINDKKETKKVQFVVDQPSILDKAEERQLDSADSIGKEMTHFKPIRLMPLSAIYISDKILKIPTIRHTNPKEKSFFFQAPAKSKFKPEFLVKSRRSAFCLVSDIQSTENQKHNSDTTKDSIDSIESNSYTRRRNGAKSKEKIICNIMLNKTNCKKMLQERDDFELAKMLQEYDSNGRTEENGNRYAEPSLNQIQEPSARTRRYYLRTRSKQISDEKDVAAGPAKKAKVDTKVRQTDSNKVVENGRKTRSSGSSNGVFDKRLERLTRGRKKL